MFKKKTNWVMINVRKEILGNLDINFYFLKLLIPFD